MKSSTKWQQLNRFVDYVAPHLRPAEVRVWLYLFRRCTASGAVRFSHSHLAKATGVDRRHVRQAVNRLCQLSCLSDMTAGDNWRRHTAQVVIDERWEQRPHPLLGK